MRSVGTADRHIVVRLELTSVFSDDPFSMSDWNQWSVNRIEFSHDFNLLVLLIFEGP